MNIKFKDLQQSCRHQGWTKAGGIKMCSYKDGNPAKCWDDWQECKEKNCPLAHHKTALKVIDAEVEQLSFAANGNITPCPYRAICLTYPVGCHGESYWCKRYDRK